MGAGASIGVSDTAKGGLDKEIQRVVHGFKELSGSQKKALVELVDQVSGDRNGTSTLEVDQGFFRLIQGASYRVYKPKYALNYHTHLQDRSLPYLWTNFVSFVRAAYALVESLGIEQMNLLAWKELVACVEEEDQKLQNRIASFDSNSLSEAQRVAHEKVLADRKQREGAKEEFVALTHAVYASKHETTELAEVVERVAHSAGGVEISEDKVEQCKEKFRTEKHMVGFFEGFEPECTEDTEQSPTSFIDQWNQVLIEASDEEIDGAMICNRFWYESFMPLLAAACTSSDEQMDVDEWFEQTKDEFQVFAGDVLDGFAQCSKGVKVTIRRVWRLTRHYLLGPQKRRERWKDSGADHRKTGDLSQYVAFIDVFLNRSYVERAQMRLTFPYFIGPPTWKLLHTIAEIACTCSGNASTKIVEKFKSFFRLFATLYPCPYCRHHLNRYVVLGKERGLYPVEYLLLGWTSPAENPEGQLNIENKLLYITDAGTLRLFLWKLHNSVNASIARSEAWYHSDQEAIYTSRYWPNIDAELLRANQIGVGVVSASRIEKITSILKCGTRLAAAREQILNVAKQDPAIADKVIQHVNCLIATLDKAVVDGGFLQEVYTYNPSLEDPSPALFQSVTELESSFIRHEDFTLS